MVGPGCWWAPEQISCETDANCPRGLTCDESLTHEITGLHACSAGAAPDDDDVVNDDDTTPPQDDDDAADDDDTLNDDDAGDDDDTLDDDDAADDDDTLDDDDSVDDDDTLDDDDAADDDDTLDDDDTADDDDALDDDDTANDDVDGDGYTSEASGGDDCDDQDPNIHPGAEEAPNGVDDDCDGFVDEPYVGTLNASAFAPSAEGLDTGEHFGQSLSTAGDFNGDGLSDFASGSGSFSLGTGRAHLVLGTAYNAATPPATFDIHASIDGEAEGVYLGERVDLGDINDDGFDDLIVGKPMFNSTALPAGAVYVWFGHMSPASGTWTLDSADVVIVGEQPTEQCGAAVAALGDVNGDGIGDLGLTCPWYSESTGPFQGRLLVFLGSQTWSPSLDGSDAHASIVGTSADGGMGQALAGDFDANGDGIADVMVGSTEWNADAGRAALKLGGTSVWSLGESVEAADAIYTGSTGDLLGSGLAAGDGDGDQFADLLLAAPWSGSGFGAVHIVQGSAAPAGGTSLATSSYWVTGGAVLEMAETSATFMDLSGDGERDLVVATPAYDGTGGDSGRVAVFYGPLAALSGPTAIASADLYIVGSAQGDFFGSSVVALPDFNGDGTEDLAISSSHSGVLDTGTVYIVPGF